MKDKELHRWNKILFNDLVKPLLTRAQRREKKDKLARSISQSQRAYLNEHATINKEFVTKVIRRHHEGNPA